MEGLVYKNGEPYVLQMFVACNDYLIPYDGSKYWEHHFVDKNLWIEITEDFNFEGFDMTREEYEVLYNESEKRHKEILAKYHASF